VIVRGEMKPRPYEKMVPKDDVKAYAEYSEDHAVLKYYKKHTCAFCHHRLNERSHQVACIASHCDLVFHRACVGGSLPSGKCPHCLRQDDDSPYPVAPETWMYHSNNLFGWAASDGPAMQAAQGLHQSQDSDFTFP